MKLRLKGNSIRLRLTQSEVAEWVDARVIYEIVNFGNSRLIYQLNLTDANELSAVYEQDCMTIHVPKVMGIKWAQSDQVGMEEVISLDRKGTLSILIEKDFKCLTDRPNEDESDLFENPLQRHDC